MAPKVKLNWHQDVDFLDGIFLHCKGGTFHANYSCSSLQLITRSRALCVGALSSQQGLEVRAGVTARPSNLTLVLGVGDPTQPEAREEEKALREGRTGLPGSY